MSKLEKGVIMQTIKYQICIVTTLQSFLLHAPIFASDHLSDPNQRQSVRKQWRNRAENHAKWLQNGRKTPKNGYWKARGLFGSRTPRVRVSPLRPSCMALIDRPQKIGVFRRFSWFFALFHAFSILEKLVIFIDRVGHFR